MKNRKPTVTIGIPAYNEEANIKSLLKSLLSQRQSNFSLKEIIVISDGSTDRTVKEAKKVSDERVKVIEGIERRGQAYRQNEICSRANADFLVLLNADILIKNNSFFIKIMKASQNKKNVGIIVSRAVTLPPSSFIGKILEWHAAWKRKLYEQINNDNIYLNHGLMRTFPKRVYKKLQWPKSWAEDAYSYLFIKKLELDFVCCKEAQVYYRLPQTLKDHVHQSVRFMYSSKALAPFFSKEELRSAYAIPRKLLITSMLDGLINNPLKAVTYLVIYAYCKAVAVFTRTASEYDLWEISTSTKTLNTGAKSLN